MITHLWLPPFTACRRNSFVSNIDVPKSTQITIASFGGNLISAEYHRVQLLAEAFWREWFKIDKTPREKLDNQSSFIADSMFLNDIYYIVSSSRTINVVFCNINVLMLPGSVKTLIFVVFVWFISSCKGSVLILTLIMQLLPHHKMQVANCFRQWYLRKGNSNIMML